MWLGKWNAYVPDITHITQRGATYVIADGDVVYQHCDRNILGFATDMSRPHLARTASNPELSSS
ncbi:hypothetical protein [Leptothoe sp. PORK10 BA2]|uniref:hypothetical protein n=1 Tax=Leptothoe sp. PORK10 BA2 TaxID=3110254 RepID=UPI002B2207A3|nr:hypothetical protein [Leptothoe sp. PORK10 BA2]